MNKVDIQKVRKKRNGFASKIPHRKKEKKIITKGTNEGKQKQKDTQEQITKLIEISPMKICAIEHAGGWRVFVLHAGK